eukprot:59363_1
MKDIIAYIIPDLYMYADNNKLPPYIETLLKYHLNNPPNKIEYDFREITHGFQWVQDIFTRDENIPNIANACNLFKHCKHITFIMSDDHHMNLESIQSIIKDTIKITNSPNIEFKWSVPRDLPDIENKFNICCSELHTTIDTKQNSIIIIPTNIMYEEQEKKHDAKTKKTGVGTSFEKAKSVTQPDKNIICGYLRDCQRLLPTNQPYYQIYGRITMTIILFCGSFYSREKIDNALNLYYRALGRYDYFNDHNMGEFAKFCYENGFDVGDIHQKSCSVYAGFDEDFPFIDKEYNLDQTKKNEIVYEVIKSCYEYGLPPDRYRPKKKNLTRPKTTVSLVDAYLHNILSSNNMHNTDGNIIVIPKIIAILCSKFLLESHNLIIVI